MRHGFTLIELMIVIAIIAIIAAIAIPNLMESRVTSQEAAGASTLKNGMLAAEVQFQAGSYTDLDGNGIGTFAVNGILASGVAVDPYKVLCGAQATGPQNNIQLTLLAPVFGITTGPFTPAVADSTTAQSSNAQVWPAVGGYTFKTPATAIAPSSGSDGTAERAWCILSFPVDDQQGRRFFIINQSGNIYASKPSVVASSGTINFGGVATPTNGPNSPFGSSMSIAPPTAYYIPYRR